MCIYDAKLTQPISKTLDLRYLELSDKCLDPASQFKFLENGAVLKLNVPGCLEEVESATDYDLHMLGIVTDTSIISDGACADNEAVAQTSWGGLRTRSYRPVKSSSCVLPGTSQGLKDTLGIDPYLRLAVCKDEENKRFHFGTVTWQIGYFYTIRINFIR